MEPGKAEIDWSELIIVFNSLVGSIESLRNKINSDMLDDDDLYDAEEELNDYVMLIARLRQRYEGIPDKGEISGSLSEKLKDIC